MSKPPSAADTLPALSFPPNGRTGKYARGAAAGLSGVGVAGAVIFYLLTCISTNSDRIQAVESKVEAISDNLSDIRQGQREIGQKIDTLASGLTAEVGVLNAKIGRIEGYIAAQRDSR